MTVVSPCWSSSTPSHRLFPDTGCRSFRGKQSKQRATRGQAGGGISGLSVFARESRAPGSLGPLQPRHVHRPRLCLVQTWGTPWVCPPQARVRGASWWTPAVLAVTCMRSRLGPGFVGRVSDRACGQRPGCWQKGWASRRAVGSRIGGAGGWGLMLDPRGRPARRTPSSHSSEGRTLRPEARLGPGSGGEAAAFPQKGRNR